MVIPLLLAGLAHADPLAPGTLVVIDAVSKKDAFYENRGTLVGQACRVGPDGMNPSGRGWHGGPATCSDGQDYFFYRVRLTVLPDGVAALVAPTQAPAVPDAPEVTAEVLNQGASMTEWRPGSVGTITGISDEDAFASSRATLLGKRCRVSVAPLSPSGEGWWSGELACEDTSYYFYQVGLKHEPAFLVDATWPAGSLAKVVAVDPTDAHHAVRERLEGHTCSVIASPLVPSGDATFGGRLFCDDGSHWQVFRVRLAAPEPSPPAR
jgi:hypothetical protein